MVFLLPNLSTYGDSFSIFDVLGAELVSGVGGAGISVVGVRSSKHRALDRHQGGGWLLYNTRETGLLTAKVLVMLSITT